MPKRSNEFQQLIYLLHLQLHDRAVVTESAMLPDRFGGAAQEIDVLMEEPVGQISMLIGVECRDRGRKATVEWVQQMRGKHEHRTDKLVLVSRSGFTIGALEEAQRHGIETMDLHDAVEADWNTIANKLKEVFIGQFAFTISKGYAELEEVYRREKDPEISAAEVLYSPDGEVIGPVGQIAMERLQLPDAARDLMDLFYQNQDKTRGTVAMDIPTGCYLMDASSTKRLVHSIRLEVRCDLRISPVALQHGAVGVVNVAWGRMASGNEELFLLSSEQKGKPSRAALRITRRGQQTEEVVDLMDDKAPRGQR